MGALLSKRLSLGLDCKQAAKMLNIDERVLLHWETYGTPNKVWEDRVLADYKRYEEKVEDANV